MATATKAESQKIFEKLKTKPANKVGKSVERGRYQSAPDEDHRYALIAEQKTQLGPQCHLAYTFASIALPTTATWESIFRL